MERLICQGSIPEFKNDGDKLDRYYLPGRSLVLEGSLYLLPDKEMVVKYADQFNEILLQLGLQPRRMGFIPDSTYLLDEAIFNNLGVMEKLLSRQVPYQVYPYAVTENLEQWIEGLRELGFMIKPMFPKKVYFEDLHHPAHRGGWGKWVNDPERPSFPEKAELPYPTSWIGTNLEEVIEAYHRVCQEAGTSTVVVKPIFSAGGFTVGVVTNEEELVAYYQNLEQSGALDLFGEKNPIEIQSMVTNITGFYSLQYLKGKLITPGEICQQIVDGTHWQGNIFNFNSSSSIFTQIEEQATRIWKSFYTHYPNIREEWGGLDFALKKNEELIILEHNGQRMTGAIPAIAAASQLGVVQSPFASLKAPADPACDLKTLWEYLSRKKIAYDPATKKGILPIIWLPGSGMLWAAGNDPLQLLDKAYQGLEVLGYLKTDGKRSSN